MKHEQLNHIIERMSRDCYFQKESESIMLILYNLSVIVEVEKELEEKFSEIHPDVIKILEKMKLYVTLQYSLEFSLNRALVKTLQEDLLEMGYKEGELFKDMSIFFK